MVHAFTKHSGISSVLSEGDQASDTWFFDCAIMTAQQRADVFRSLRRIYQTSFCFALKQPSGGLSNLMSWTTYCHVVAVKKIDVKFESSKQKLTSLNLLKASNIFCLTSSLCEPAHLFAACHWCVTNSCGSTWNLSRHCVRAALSREKKAHALHLAPHTATW